MFKLYNGCPNKELADYWRFNDEMRNNVDGMVKSLFGLSSKGCIVYFPLEEKYHFNIFIGHTYYDFDLNMYDSISVCGYKALETLKRIKL